jgi:hypothetical protein
MTTTPSSCPTTLLRYVIIHFVVKNDKLETINLTKKQNKTKKCVGCALID